MKCSQTDCFSSEKEKRNLNHREKWFLGKKKKRERLENDYLEAAKFHTKKIRIEQKYFRFG